MESTNTHAAPYLLISLILFFLFGAVAYGMYSSFGPGANGLKDTIDEHARMHEMGIAHTHGDRG
nr:MULTISPECIES: photosystem II reaction center protein PsbN [Prochlorococcus]